MRRNEELACAAGGYRVAAVRTEQIFILVRLRVGKLVEHDDIFALAVNDVAQKASEIVVRVGGVSQKIAHTFGIQIIHVRLGGKHFLGMVSLLPPAIYQNCVVAVGYLLAALVRSALRKGSVFGGKVVVVIENDKPVRVGMVVAAGRKLLEKPCVPTGRTAAHVEEHRVLIPATAKDRCFHIGPVAAQRQVAKGALRYAGVVVEEERRPVFRVEAGAGFLQKVIDEVQDITIVVLGSDEREQPDVTERPPAWFTANLPAVGPGQCRQVRVLHVRIDSRVAGFLQKLAARELPAEMKPVFSRVVVAQRLKEKTDVDIFSPVTESLVRKSVAAMCPEHAARLSLEVGFGGAEQAGDEAIERRVTVSLKSETDQPLSSRSGPVDVGVDVVGDAVIRVVEDALANDSFVAVRDLVVEHVPGKSAAEADVCP